MLRPMDRFLSALRRESAEELIIKTGQPIHALAGQSIRVLLAQPVKTDQITSILKGVIPPESERDLADQGEATFPYASPTGVYSIHCVTEGPNLSVRIRSLGSAAATKTATAPASWGSAPAAAAPTTTTTPPTPSPPAPAKTAVGKAAVTTKAPPLPAAAKSPPPPMPPAAAAPAAPAPPETPAAQPSVPAESPRAPAPAGASRIDTILVSIFKAGASDLHLTATLTPRMRKDGEIVPVPGFANPLSGDTIRSLLLEIAPPASRDTFEKTRDADFAYEIRGLSRFRVNLFKDRLGVSAVLRVIPSTILSADDLKLPQVVRDLCGLQKGLVLVTGPTGSGKSTTLAAMIDLINQKRNEHIITIEDPVEFVHPSKQCLVNQREVHSDTNSFSAALRAALREDPDIVLVGEMRDLETVAIAIETAETGHLVFGTLHTNTAVSTVDRIIDQFPADRQAQIRIMLSESLRGVIAQTLCKRQSGGRVAALEIMIGIPSVANVIREGKTFQLPSLLQTSKGVGMQTLSDALFQLAKDGVISPDEAYRKAIDRVTVKAMLERANMRVTAQ
jgi:twitching motility protein PilT